MRINPSTSGLESQGSLRVDPERRLFAPPSKAGLGAAARVNRTRYLTQNIAKVLIWIAAFSTIAVMILILFQILKEGLPVLHLRFFVDSPKSMGREGGIFSTIIGTMALAGLSGFSA